MPVTLDDLKNHLTSLDNDRAALRMRCMVHHDSCKGEIALASNHDSFLTIRTETRLMLRMCNGYGYVLNEDALFALRVQCNTLACDLRALSDKVFAALS